MGPGSKVRFYVSADQQNDKQALEAGWKLPIAEISALISTQQPWGSQALHPEQLTAASPGL